MKTAHTPSILTTSPSAESLIFACQLDGKGGAIPLDWKGLEDHWLTEELVWAHLNYNSDRTRNWLEERSDIHEIIGEFLTNDETRPTSLVQHNGLLLILRGVNYSYGAEPEDMASLRLWISESRIASFRSSQSLVVEDLIRPLEQNVGITRAGEFLVELLDRVISRIRTVINEFEDILDEIEEESLRKESPISRSRILNLRRQAIGLRRHLYPQKEVLEQLPNIRVSWLTDDDRINLKRISERQTRYVEELDFIRERTSLLQEELTTHATEAINHKIYFISLIACIFLPLSFVTGLLGINVGGIPLADSPSGFFYICLLLGSLAVMIALIIRRKKWL
jgi:zinc transporter